MRGIRRELPYRPSPTCEVVAASARKRKDYAVNQILQKAVYVAPLGWPIVTLLSGARSFSAHRGWREGVPSNFSDLHETTT
jgi:hypothetical protein